MVEHQLKNTDQLFGISLFFGVGNPDGYQTAPHISFRTPLFTRKRSAQKLFLIPNSLRSPLNIGEGNSLPSLI